MTFSDLTVGQQARLMEVNGEGELRKRWRTLTGKHFECCCESSASCCSSGRCRTPVARLSCVQKTTTVSGTLHN